MGLRQQADAIIQTCEKVLDTVGKGKDAKEYADHDTVQIANKIIESAQAASKGDEVLAAIKLNERFVTWTSLLAAMRTVYNSLPMESGESAVYASRGGGA
jgi:hypothetical protein